MDFDDPKPAREKRVQQLVYMRPSIRTEIDILRASTRENRSEWIERAIQAELARIRKNTGETADAD